MISQDASVCSGAVLFSIPRDIVSFGFVRSCFVVIFSVLICRRVIRCDGFAGVCLQGRMVDALADRTDEGRGGPR